MKYFSVILFLVYHIGANSQVFPIQVNPQLTPPYTPYLSDYTAPGSQHFMLQIIANDITLTNYRCKLRIAIEGTGITLSTKENFNPRPFLLDGGGIPQIFYGEDLWEYFDPDALDFSGYTRSEYMKRTRLPEGVYRFTVEVLDYNRGTVVSNKGTALAWIMLNDPPMLNLPTNFSRLKVQDPVNILFAWTPRHTGSPNAAFSTEYIFRLLEIWPDNRNPYDAFLTQRPLFETSTTQHQFLYGTNEPSLIPGRKYAWQVQARDTDGKDLFKNNGRSEVFVLQFGELLAVPENLQMRWAKPTTLAIRWDPVDGNGEEIKYRLQYRPWKRRGNHQWYQTRTQFTEKTLYDLDHNTEYEMRVRAEKIFQESEYTEIRIFKTLPLKPDAFVCREDVTPVPLPEPTLPVFPLSINDTIDAGGYEILVRDVIEMENKYYGSGVAIVPWFNSAKVRVTFERIGVNDRFRLTAGTIRSIWNPESEFLLAAETTPTSGNVPQTADPDMNITAVDSLITVEGTSIAALTRDEEGNIVLTTTDGTRQILTAGKRYAIADGTGNGYVVDQVGNITRTTATEAKALASGGKGGSPALANQETPETKLIAELLSKLESDITGEIDQYQPSFPRGAGPIADFYIRPMRPACLPDDHEKLAIIRRYVKKTLAEDSAMRTLVENVLAHGENKKLITQLAHRTNPGNQRFEDLLTNEEYKKVEEVLCPHVAENAKQDYGKIWWRAPVWERASAALAKHLRKRGLTATVECESRACLTTVEFQLSGEVTSAIVVRFGSDQSSEKIAEALTLYGLDALRIIDVTEEDFIDWWWNWMALQDARIYERDHGGLAVIEFIADVIMAPTLYPAISGWVSGKHWRNGRALKGWEQALAALDFLIAEEVVKGCITNFIVRIGRNSINLLRLSAATKYLLKKSVHDGLKFSVIADDEIIILTTEGEEVGRIIQDVLTVRYPKFGGDIVCDPVKTTTVIGRFEDIMDGGGIKVIKENKLYQYGENPGGVNIMDDGAWAWPVNENWLSDAVQRNDIIRLISDPDKAENIYIFKNGKSTEEFTNFGKEIIFLRSKGFKTIDNIMIR